jgi:hypothetical protein
MFPRSYTPEFDAILGGPPKCKNWDFTVCVSSWCGALELSSAQNILQLYLSKCLLLLILYVITKRSTKKNVWYLKWDIFNAINSFNVGLSYVL